MQAIAKGDVLQRMASVSFIVAAVFLLVVNAIFPRASDPSDTKAWLEAWANAGSPLFQVLSLLLAVSFWAMVMGIAGIYRSHTEGGAAALTRLGFYGILVGATLWTLSATNQIGMSSVLAEWVKAGEPAKTTLFLTASSLMNMTNAVFSMTVFVYWSALAFLGVGMVLGDIYPKWLSWGLVILGVITAVAVGLPQVLAGPSSPVTNVFFPILAGLTTLWALAAGIWLARRAW